MRNHLLIILLAVLCSCAAPISYINNLPKSSGLQERGDVRLDVNIGSDVTRRDKVIQVGGAWSPIQNFGIDLEYSGHLKLEGRTERLEKIQFIEGSLIYYWPLRNESSIELKVSKGSGRVGGLSTIFNFPGLPAEDFIVSSEYQTWSFQPSYNFYNADDDFRGSIGFRVRNVQFDSYIYNRLRDDVSTGQSLILDDWNVVILDPFLEANQQVAGQLFLNSRLSYSILEGTIRDNFRHPFHRKLGITIGLQLKF